MNESNGACEEGTAEAGRDFDPLSPEDEERTSEGQERPKDEPPRPRHDLGITHGSPLPEAERERLKEKARRGGTRDRGGPAQRDRGD